jgi:hypothetical protein
MVTTIRDAVVSLVPAKADALPGAARALLPLYAGMLLESAYEDGIRYPATVSM